MEIREESEDILFDEKEGGRLGTTVFH